MDFQAALGIVASILGIVAALVTIASVWASRRGSSAPLPTNGGARSLPPYSPTVQRGRRIPSYPSVVIGTLAAIVAYVISYTLRIAPSVRASTVAAPALAALIALELVSLVLFAAVWIVALLLAARMRRWGWLSTMVSSGVLFFLSLLVGTTGFFGNNVVFDNSVVFIVLIVWYGSVFAFGLFGPTEKRA